MKVKKISPSVSQILEAKASKSDRAYRVAAVAFDKKGNILGSASCGVSKLFSLEKYRDMCAGSDGGIGGRKTGEHAERKLLGRYRGNIRTIVICRFGRSGGILPIDPCPVCSKVAAKYGVRIVSVCPGRKPRSETLNLETA